LALAFWGIRDWLRGPWERAAEGMTRDTSQLLNRSRNAPGGAPEGPSLAERIPSRLRLLLWILCLNAVALVLVCLAQRAAGTSDLLFLIKSRSGKSADAVFGPWSYRSNAAQYFSLIWPLCLAFWLWLQTEAYQSRDYKIARFDGPQLLLVPTTLLIAAAPAISGSRAAVLVSILIGSATLGVLLAAPRPSRIMGKIRRVAACILLGSVSFVGVAATEAPSQS
jgi:hypothetical protein